jgi:hypothetical protein
MTHDKTTSTPLAKGSFTESTTMADVLRLNPNAQWTLRQFHIGGCHHCGFDANDSISKVASDHGIPIPMLVQALNN